MRPSVCIVIASLVVALDPSRAHAQDDTRFIHRFWGVEDGLPVNAVRDLAQDERGFLWLATVEGLVRFDGQEFTVFNAGNSDGFPNNRLLRVAAVSGGQLLIELEGTGLFVRQPDGSFGPLLVGGEVINGWIKRFERGVRSSGPNVVVDVHQGGWYPGQKPRWLAFSESGVTNIEGPAEMRLPEAPGVEVTVWIRDGRLAVTKDNIRGYIDWTEGEARPLRGVDGRFLAGGPIYEHPEGVVWHLEPDGALYRLSGSRFERVSMDLPTWFLELEGGWNCFAREPGGAFVIGRARDGLWRYHDGKITRLSALRAGGCHEFVDSRGILWMATGTTLVRNGTVLDEGTNFTRLIEDANGTVWASSEKGLHAYIPSEVRMHTGIGDDNVYTIIEDQHGRMWTSSWGLVTDWVFTDGAWREVPGSDGHPVGMAARDGRLFLDSHWTRTVPHRLPRPDEWQRVPYNHRGGPVRAIFEDSLGRIWLAAPGRDLWVIEGTGSSLVHQGAQFRTVAESEPGVVWLGSEKRGIARHKDGAFTFYGHEQGLGSNTIRWILTDPDVPDRLWVATEDNGLNRVDLDRDTADPVGIVHFTEREGLFRNGLHAVLQDDFGRLWMNTNYGVFWVWKDELNAVADGLRARVEPVVYTDREGLANREGNGGYSSAGLKSSDGHIWFPTQGGLAEFDPARISERPPPRAAILGMSANGSVAGPTLAPDERDFSIRFTAPDFTAPERLRFEYRLLGYDHEWRVTPAREVSFTNLDPGAYTFEVRARAHADAAPVAARVITILPFWYETLAFRLFMVLAAVGLVFGAGRLVSRQARERERRLNAQVAERTLDLRREKELTERQAAELRELNMAKSRFFANVSHEFRTPLTLIIGPLRQLLAREGHPDRESLELMQRNADRLLGMVNRILELARLESKTLPYEPECIDLSAHVRQTALGMTALAEREGLTLIVGAAPPLFALFDRGLMERIVTNLVSNAVKFTDRGGHVFVNVRSAGEHALIEVRDTGIGIAADKLPLIFDRFYQADPTSTRRYQGTGIGLSLVKELAELHGGHVSVESREGHGSTFLVRMPLVPDQLDGARQTITPDVRGDGPVSTTADLGADPSPAPGEEDRPTALLVDDNEDIRTFMRSALQATYAVVEAVDGRDALDHVERGLLPDVIVCDVMMPRMDGMELHRALQATPDTEGLPFIFLTALADDEHRLEGARSGADRYLTKPLDPALLLAEMAGVLESRRRLVDRLRGAMQVSAEPEAPFGPFERKVRAVVEERLADADLTSEDLAAQVGLSYSQLHRKLKAEADVTPTELVRRVRLEHAVALLEREDCTISEAAYAVGFNSLSYFNRCFKAVYGTSPSAFRQQA
ncbi:MAG: helix-turn-helix domain-containing protein [Rhodothermales bacterium]|nr:helix-turn-helix domain-containing protein [Rhodothermales bacterium]MBO6780347.1 helix-turn-helix domain-containing protein [Rhodothermales bacterium]